MQVSVNEVALIIDENNQELKKILEGYQNLLLIHPKQHVRETTIHPTCKRF